MRNNDIVDDETSQVCQYGFEIIISTLAGFLLVVIIGLCCRELLSAILFYALFIGVRLSTGGYHADTLGKCKIVFIMICLLLTLTSCIKVLLMPMIIIMIGIVKKCAVGEYPKS